MSAQPILNPDLPYVGEVEGGLTPGKMVKVQGKAPEGATRFALNYQLGPNLNPRDDIAIHVSPRFNDGFITRNSIQSMTWGPEENHGPMWIQRGEPFEIILLCEYYCYKIAINGRHFAEFSHRLPYEKVTHLVIDGEVEISSIFYETIPIGPRPTAPATVPDVPPVNVGPPPPGGLYPSLNVDEKYGPQPDTDDFRNNPPRAYGYQPGPQKAEEEDAFGGCLDKVGLAVGGLVAAGGVAAAMHAYNKNKKKHAEEEDHERSEAKESESGFGGLGALGAALASSLASNALQGDRNAHAQQGYPPQDSGMLGSILGALGGGGGGGAPPPNYNQQPPADPFGGALGSILGGVLGGGGGAGHQQPPPYQPSGGYGGYPQGQGGGNVGSGGGGGNDLLSGLGGVLLKSAMDGLSKKSHKSQQNDQDGSGGGGYYPAPQQQPPPYGRYDTDVPPSHAPPSPPGYAGGRPKLSAAEISKGLGLSDDEN